MTLTLAQLEQRRQFIGASDVAAVYGVSPWVSPFALWLDKTGQIPIDDTPTLPMRLGDACEPLVCELVGEAIGKPVNWNDGSMPTARKGVLGANIDGCVDDGALVEAKTVTTEHGQIAWGDPGTDAVPDHYWLQCQAQMLCTGADLVHLGVLFLGGHAAEFQLYRIEASNDGMQDIFEVCTAWWQTHVEGGVEPEDRDVHPRDGEVLKRRRRVEGKAVDINPILFEAERKATAEAKAATARMENLRTQIKRAMGDAETGIVGDQIVRYAATSNGSRRWAVKKNDLEVGDE